MAGPRKKTKGGFPQEGECSGDSKDLPETLKDIFSNVNNWLKYGETKNAVLIGFNGGAIFGLVRLLQGDIPLLPPIVLQSIILIILLSIVSSLVSFFPRISSPSKSWLRKAEPSQSDNLLFFDHIRKYESTVFLETLCKSMGVNKSSFSKHDNDYSNQIVINSRIASWKYYFFKLSLYLDFLGIIGLLLFLTLDALG